MLIDCSEQSKNEIDLNVNPGVPHSKAQDLRNLYFDAYVTKAESDSPTCEPEMTICVKHEQLITFRVD